MASDGVRIESRPGLGNVLVANKAFKPGDVVVFEEPLLHVPHLKPSNPLYKPLQAFFEQHGIPSSVVLKVMAFSTAEPAAQARVLQCGSPDPGAFADAAVVQQAQLFARLLLEHPPVPEFAAWVSQPWTLPPAEQQQQQDREQQQQQDKDEGKQGEGHIHHQQQQQQMQPFDLLVKLWLIWVTNGHSFRLGSALFHYGSKLTHTCGAPNTAYRTAAGDSAPVHGMAAGSNSSAAGQLPPAAAAAAGAAAAAAAGYHVALAEIQPGDVLTTNYLGLGHKRLMSTPARQKLLQDKFLFKCTCRRCTREVDMARGIPCPCCSGPFRAADKLLTEELGLPQDTLLPPPGSTAAAATGTAAAAPAEEVAGGADKATAAVAENALAAAEAAGGSDKAAAAVAEGGDGAAGDGSSSSSSRCGFIYCDMAKLLSGAAAPWKCDECGMCFPNDTLELWGRYYARSHTHIESDMEGWVMRLDESMDTAPLVREPSSLHDRLLGVVRLLGPRHWASWRLLLLGVELHCGVLEQAAMQHKICPARPPPTETAAAAMDSARSSSSQSQQQQQQTPQQARASETVSRVSGWVLRYCRQVWLHVSACYGQIEAGQVLGYHFTEAAQVLLQVSSCPGLLPSAAAESVMDAALAMQQCVLPGMRSLMGQDYSPLAQLMGQPAAGGGAAATEAAVSAALAAAYTGGLSGGVEEGGAGAAGSGAAAAAAGAGGAAGGGPGKYVAANVKRYLQQQAAEAARVQQLVAELKQMEPKTEDEAEPGKGQGQQ